MNADIAFTESVESKSAGVNLVGMKSVELNECRYRIHNLVGMKVRGNLSLYNPSESSTTVFLLSYTSVYTLKNSSQPSKTFDSFEHCRLSLLWMSLTSALLAFLISDTEVKIAVKPLCLSQPQTLLSSLYPISVLHICTLHLEDSLYY